MGFNFFPVYGEDLASVIETAKRLIEKIESGKFDETTLKEFANVNEEIIKYASNK
jgi:hypothetical protein